MAATSEVFITLTPYECSHDAEPRILTLDAGKSIVDVGRASKNASKGLMAGKNNAWFESPTMSREHARFSVAFSPQRAIYLEDLGSTHGTYFEYGRLEVSKKYVCTHGSYVTFGSRVTTGTLTYPGRIFRVEIDWKNSESLTIHSNNSLTMEGVNRGFFVPDDENGTEVTEDRFEEKAAIQIRSCSFTMPSSSVESDDGISSDEDSVLIDVNVQTPPSSDRPSNSTTPEDSSYSSHKQSLPSIPAFLNYTETVEVPRPEIIEDAQNAKEDEAVTFIGTNAGNSQENPIELDSEKARRTVIAVDESEDEDVEAVYISTVSDPVKFVGEKEVEKEVEQEGETVMTINESDAEGPDVLPINTTLHAAPTSPVLNLEGVAMETEHSELPSSRRGLELRRDAPVIPDSDMDVIEAEESDAQTSDDEPDNISRDSQELDSDSADYFDSEDDCSDDDGVEDDYLDQMEDNKQVQVPDRLLGSSNLLATTSSPHVTFKLNDDIIPHNPRIGSLVEESPTKEIPTSKVSWSGTKDLACTCTDVLDQPSDQSHRAPSPSDAALAKLPPTTKLSSTNQYQRPGSDSLGDFTVKYQSLNDRLASARQARGCEVRDLLINDLASSQDPPSRSYNFAEPFGYNPCSYDSYIHDFDDGLYGPPRGLYRYRDGPFATQAPGVLPPMIVTSQPNSRESCLIPDSSATGPENSPTDLREIPRKTDGSSTTILSIQDLVDGPHQSDSCSPRGQKRKAEDPQDSLDDSTSSLAPCSPIQLSLELPHSDAQSRDITSSHDVDTNPLPSSGVSEEIKSFRVIDSEDPPKKKARITAKRPGRVGAFVSGFVAGGLALAGAFATIVATVPENVREEAWREAGFAK